MCRFCAYAEDTWTCTRTSEPVRPEDTCRMFRPGSCENCISIVADEDGTVCGRTGEKTYILDVCSDYAPAGRKSV